MPWKRPTHNQTLAAIGDLSGLPADERACYTVDNEAWKALPAKPRSGDWLAHHNEPGQSFKSFTRRSFRCSPHGHCDCMYIVPIGEFDENRAPPLDSLVGYARAHFGCTVKVHPAVAVEAVSENSRVGDEGQLQLDAGTVRSFLCKGLKAPRDSFCLLAITMQDLYIVKNGEAWNFVFGQASMMDGVGVFSFARYDPTGEFLTAQGTTNASLPPMSVEERQEVLRRSCRVLAHEGTHVVGLKHCIHFGCLMNGSNHLQESDRAPLHLCPLCLRKLAAACSFHPLQRYMRLAEWYEQHGFEEQREWTQARIAAIKEASPTGAASATLPHQQVSVSGNGRSERVMVGAPPRSNSTHTLNGTTKHNSAASGANGSVCALFRCRGKKGCLCPSKGSCPAAAAPDSNAIAAVLGAV